MILAPQGVSTDDGSCTLSWLFRRPGASDFPLRISLPEAHAGVLVQPERADHALVVTLLHAMRLAVPEGLSEPGAGDEAEGDAPAAAAQTVLNGSRRPAQVTLHLAAEQWME